jgi:hypothetical protein
LWATVGFERARILGTYKGDEEVGTRITLFVILELVLTDQRFQRIAQLVVSPLIQQIGQQPREVVEVGVSWTDADYGHGPRNVACGDVHISRKCVTPNRSLSAAAADETTLLNVIVPGSGCKLNLPLQSERKRSGA